MPEEKGGWSVTQNREPLRQRIHLTRAAAPVPVVSKAKEPGHQIAHLPRMSWNMKHFPVFYVVIDKLHKLFHRKRLQKGFSNCLLYPKPRNRATRSHTSQGCPGTWSISLCSM